ncbi:ABC transporter permease [Streptomyces albireticuli]|uniref:ABC transporter n=1 Tax=Streptomyces albireticuli TaxID=1940 RepID=A0A2A2D018_9ACTN|nr:ABC transporter permease [Streptomyces albireticuli]MCD9144540.1 ABC transporter permease [Streptomyces albireticuli]MCD9163397.1 ABC transporter permease [Streptomyces albireticuli]MCD9193217.1 ABC transporter permease [Streptomyces albireticuli]PAU44855.1 ABC transporter [Streptomyces albireticuli]
MFRTALRNVLAHKARLLMTVLAVMLGVAFVSGTLVFTNTISDAYQKSSQKGFTGVDVAVQPHKRDSGKSDPGAAPRLSQGLLDKIGQVPGAASVTGSVHGFAAVADKKGKLAGEGFNSSGANYYPGTGGKDPRYPLKSGRAPHGAGEVALDEKTAERAGYKVGDTVRISVDGPVLPHKVTGVFTTEDGNVAAGGSLALFDTATAQKLYGMPGGFDEIDVKAAAGTSQAALKSAVEKVLPKDTEATTGKQLADDEARIIAQGMDGMRTSLLVFAGISLFVGVFIIANTFTMLVAQRTKELALMRAVGASRRQVTRSVLIEAFVVGAVAGVAGLLAGIGIGAGLRALIGGTGATVPDGPLVVSPGTVVTSLVVGIVVTMLAAWLPGRRAAKIPPVAAMNSVHAVATTKSLVVRNSIGGVLTALGAAVVLTASSSTMMGLGAGLVLIGVFVLTPLLSRPVIAAAAPLLRPFGMPGKLARQNAVRNPRRTAATASALMIGLTLITGLTVIAGSVQQALDKMATGSLKADYVVSMAGMTPLSTDVEKKLSAHPDVTATSPLRDSPSRIDGDHQQLKGVDGRNIGKLTNLEFTAGSFGGLTGDKVVVDDATARAKHWKLGTSFPVTFEDGEQGRLTVSGVYKGNALMDGIMVDTRTLTPHQSQVDDRQVMVKTKGGVKETTEDSLRKALGDNPAIQIQTKQDISDGISKMIGLLLNMLYGLLAMAVVVAVLGVVNTLAMSVFERQQEIGMLRAIGLDRKGIKRMVRLESLIISLFGGVLGVGLGVFFGWAAGDLIKKGLSTYELVLPWGRMGVFLLLAALVGVLAALWPARRAAKLNMLAAIKAE